jgi:RIO kinase 1
MSRNYEHYLGDEYAEYEDQFDPIHSDRQARRKRKPKVKHTPKKSDHEVIEEIAATTGLEGGFNPTYKPGPFEGEWLLDSLRDFYDTALISDVLAIVKGGKEASVYRCAANPTTGHALLAAKVYRPRKFRNLRNDKLYREGRAILKENGKEIKNNDHRAMRAIGKKTDFGEQLEHTSWLMYEYTTLKTLFDAGAAVPQPIAASTNAILMGYVGDDAGAAPALNEIDLDADEAAPLLDTVLHNIELMLKHGFVHGDLSAYNILYWEGAITLIDFPQVTDVQANTSALDILRRDVTRVCGYFAAQGVERDPEPIVGDLWARYGGESPDDRIIGMGFEVE